MTLTLLLSLACSPPAPPAAPPPGAADRTVDCNGGADHTTLNAAIDAASDQDIIDVEPCTYTERVTFDGKSVTLRSTAGAATTIIDPTVAGAVVAVDNGENVGTGLIGFTLTGGTETSSGAAVAMDLSHLRLEDVVITGNTGETIVNGYGGHLELRNVEITGNTITAGGHAIHLHRGSLDASELEIECGAGEYGIYFGHNSGLVDHATITCPATTAVHYEHATGRLQRSRLEGQVSLVSEDGNDEDKVIFENDIFIGSAGLYVFEDGVELRNSILEGGIELDSVLEAVIESNLFLDSACAIDADAATSPFVPEYNDFWNVTAESCQGTVFSGANGNLAVDPML
ncbi:MAG: hypothetical protein H0V89_02250, partial [Deltaproteobacteria bacterium]|nr:hypothetical protein [Deltaproteobacteria bacterium]